MSSALPVTDTSGARKPTRWENLDFLRGLAACLMIANHFGYSSASYDKSTLVPAITFVGGMAPVLFFLVTGLGHGIQSVSSRPGSNSRHLSRTAILLMADAFLWLRPGRFVGNDFIGFIALSSLILDMVRKSRRSMAMSSGLIVLIVIARFAVGPMVRAQETGAAGNLLGFFLGISSIPGFSYPPCPWLVYPLLGFVLGRGAAMDWQNLQTRQFSLGLRLLAIASIPLLLCVLVIMRGGVLFRYGTMSIGFFLLSLPAVFVALAVALILGQGTFGKKLAATLSLSGVRSFAVVPLHYLFLDYSERLGILTPSVWGYLIWALTAIIFSFQVSKTVPAISTWIQSTQLARWARWLVMMAVALGFILIVSGALSEGFDHLVRQCSQLALCLLFGLQPGPGRAVPALSPIHPSES